jgi:hypothetical protein
VARRRIPILISVPVLVAAFSAGIVASLWLDDDEPEPARISVSSSDTVHEAFPAPAVPAEPVAHPSVPATSVKKVEEPTAPVSAALRPVRADLDTDMEPASAHPAPGAMTLARNEVPADPPYRQKPETEEPPAPIEAKTSEPVVVARLEPEAVNTAALPALALPVGPPRDLQARGVQSTPRRYYRAVRKQVRKMVDVPILGPLFGLKYYP